MSGDWADEMAGSLCDWECPGYVQSPKMPWASVICEGCIAAALRRVRAAAFREALLHISTQTVDASEAPGVDYACRRLEALADAEKEVKP